jgi:HAD superfamily hydrolase (TIGR01490 family)
MSRACAFFDLDGTLLRRDTQSLFVQFLLKEHPLRSAMLPLFLAVGTPGLLLGALREGELKRLLLSTLWGMSAEELDALSLRFAQEVVLPRIFPKVRGEVERHRAEGRTLILNSASPEFYVRHIAALLQFDHFFGTRIVIPPRMPLVPEMEGENNKRAAKIPRMDALAPFDFENSWAYSDSQVDLPLLSLARNSVLINPKASFAQLGKSRGWHIWQLEDEG